jgi:hypothetical protein
MLNLEKGIKVLERYDLVMKKEMKTMVKMFKLEIE